MDIRISGGVWVVVVKWDEEDPHEIDSLWTDEADAKARIDKLRRRRDVTNAQMWLQQLNEAGNQA